jgi:light-regulated signal transduction histidine kinase (bacteriophytochrome)
MHTLALEHPQIDLSNCEREPIHIPGAIQPHGILFALDDVDLRISQVSDNTLILLGLSPRELLGRSIEDVIGATNLERLQEAVDRSESEAVQALDMSIATLRGQTAFDGILHRSSGELILEIEPIDQRSQTKFVDVYRKVLHSIAQFDSAHTVSDLSDVGVAEVGAISGFDRVMVYRFDCDWHGEVIAEYRDEEMESFLGLHYPASDIPKQARELFLRNWIRYIANVNYHPAAIVPSESVVTGEPLDLYRSVLRSVSPIHIEYLKNMGVGASMTLSLIKNGKLWGLIACHHRTAKIVPYEVRVGCEVIARTISLHLSSKEENESIEYRLKLKTVQVSLLEALSKDADIAHALTSAEPNLLALVGAHGAAIRLGDACTLVGRTPQLADVLDVIEWLRASGSDDVFVADSLLIVEPRFEPLAQTACGVIALPLSRVKGNYIVWFRPEALATVTWGGNPAKPVEMSQASSRIAPRKSFDRWSETVRKRAVRWQSCEIDAARELRHIIGSIIVERAEELQRVNRELTRSNVELDSFAHVAAHDLKEPLRGIHNYATDVIKDFGEVLDDEPRNKIAKIVQLSQHMDLLIESLMQVSAVGPGQRDATPTDLRQLVDGVIDMYIPQLLQLKGSISVVTPLPSVVADAVGLRTPLARRSLKSASLHPHRPNAPCARSTPLGIRRATSSRYLCGTTASEFEKSISRSSLNCSNGCIRSKAMAAALAQGSQSRAR